MKKGGRTSSRIDLEFGRIVRGPASVEDRAPSVPVAVTDLAMHPSTKTGSLLDKGNLHRRVLARKMEGS
jgi:hypothetical protein